MRFLGPIEGQMGTEHLSENSVRMVERGFGPEQPPYDYDGGG